MRKLKQNNLSLWLGLIAVAVFAVGAGVYAYSGLSPKVIVEGDYIESSQQQGFGGVNFEDETFKQDANIEGTLNVDGISTLNIPEATFEFDIDGVKATTTEDGALTIVLGSLQNTRGNMLCDMAVADVDGSALFDWNFTLSTSTYAGSSYSNTTTAGIIASTNIATSTTDILNDEDDEGGDTRNVWPIANDEYLVAAMTFDATAATSSASLTTAGGNAIAGKVMVNCVYRD